MERMAVRAFGGYECYQNVFILDDSGFESQGGELNDEGAVRVESLGIGMYNQQIDPAQPNVTHINYQNLFAR
jgi:hypothetical protein